jgi:hypothetical protein
MTIFALFGYRKSGLGSPVLVNEMTFIDRGSAGLVGAPNGLRFHKQ